MAGRCLRESHREGGTVPAGRPLLGGMNGSVVALEVFDDGSGSGPALYVGGDFTVAGVILADRIARWDGTSWSTLGTSELSYRASWPSRSSTTGAAAVTP